MLLLSVRPATSSRVHQQTAVKVSAERFTSSRLAPPHHLWLCRASPPSVVTCSAHRLRFLPCTSSWVCRVLATCPHSRLPATFTAHLRNVRCVTRSIVASVRLTHTYSSTRQTLFPGSSGACVSVSPFARAAQYGLAVGASPSFLAVSAPGDGSRIGGVVVLFSVPPDMKSPVDSRTGVIITPPSTVLLETLNFGRCLALSETVLAVCSPNTGALWVWVADSYLFAYAYAIDTGSIVVYLLNPANGNEQTLPVAVFFPFCVLCVFCVFACIVSRWSYRLL